MKRRGTTILVLFAFIVGFVFTFSCSGGPSAAAGGYADGTANPGQGNKKVQRNAVTSADKEEGYVKGEMIVRFNDTVTDHEVGGILSSIGARVLETVSKERNTFLIQLPEELSVKKAIYELSKRTDILFAEPNRIYTLGDE
jgi:hypothetical protein